MFPITKVFIKFTVKKKWLSHIRVDGVQLYLGEFNNEEEASEYYENALEAIKNGTEIQTKPTNFSSKYKGVTWNKNNNNWTAQMRIGDKHKYIGSFKTEDEASRAYENFKIANNERKETV